MIESITALHAVILVLGAVSITRLIVSDTFPPVAKLRQRFLSRFPFAGYVSNKPFPAKYQQMMTSNRSYVAQQDSWLGALIHCPYCIGFWVSLAVVVAWAAWPTVALWGCFVMGTRWLVGALNNRFD